MAVTKQEPGIQTFSLRWPATVEVRRQLKFVYDRPTDTLFVDFYGRSLPAASIALAWGDHDYAFARVDPETHRVVGLQVEEFLMHAVSHNPWLLDALEYAELRGITPREIGELRRRLAPTTSEAKGDAGRFLDHLARMTA